MLTKPKGAAAPRESDPPAGAGKTLDVDRIIFRDQEGRVRMAFGLDGNGEPIGATFHADGALHGFFGAYDGTLITGAHERRTPRAYAPNARETGPAWKVQSDLAAKDAAPRITAQVEALLSGLEA